MSRASLGSKYSKIGPIGRTVAWFLGKDDMQICEAFLIFFCQDQEWEQVGWGAEGGERG